MVNNSGLLKRYILHAFETWRFFNTKIKENHHLQGNVQVYNVRIPVTLVVKQLVTFWPIHSRFEEHAVAVPGSTMDIWFVGSPNGGLLLCVPHALQKAGKH